MTLPAASCTAPSSRQLVTEEPSSRRQGCCQGHRDTWDQGLGTQPRATPKNVREQGWDGRTYIHMGMGCLAEAEVAGRARQESQAADVVARRGGHVVVGCVGNTGCGGQKRFQHIDKKMWLCLTLMRARLNIPS